MTVDEMREQSVKAHKGIIERMMQADDQQLKEELAKKHEQQAAPYVKELEDIIARKHQNGFFTQEDAKRVRELLPLLDKIEDDKFEESDEGFQKMMQESSQRVADKQREHYESMKRQKEGIV